MPLHRFSATVAAVHQLTDDVRQLDFELVDPSDIDFKAGQFVSFEVPDLRTGRTVTRPYSIASPPSDSRTISLLLNLVPQGPGSTYLFGLRKGDRTQLTGPAGNFYLRDDPGRDLLFVATGTGIAPLRSMLFANAERAAPSRTTVFWGLRSQRDVYYQEELARLSRDVPGSSHVITLSRPEPGWTGASGRVTALVRQQIQDVKRLAVYLCGNSGMIAEVTGLIQAKGLCPIFREKYYDDTSDQEKEHSDCHLLAAPLCRIWAGSAGGGSQRTDKCSSNQGLHDDGGIGTWFALECVARRGGLASTTGKITRRTG